MNGYEFQIAGATLQALPQGALWWPRRAMLTVSDMHLGKSDRIARRSSSLLPPYETRETLGRLNELVKGLNPATVLCLGDSFDDLAAAEGLAGDDTMLLSQMMAGRRWIWIEGNHDPGPVDLGGTHLNVLQQDGLTFRHIADPGTVGEISGHYHPKARLPLGGASLSRPCFLIDDARVILPAFGTYTGGLRCGDPVLQGLMAGDARAVLTGAQALAIPMPRKQSA